jgi:hypothetical protein
MLLLCRRVCVDAGVQHVAARVLAQLHVPQDDPSGEPDTDGHTGHGEQREYEITTLRYHCESCVPAQRNKLT